ncbi:hypothetical protein QR680_014416 [Steinernema hermaphroditum]|uniref:RZ-type domain-containing protein n=1 Tax=Steinernema hermaphroditum TaxID=289476 RepID=A0AA39IB36_9BILA|nr:hypothetical protein QR680_014416 [Steinernema hermaphroditum]
MYGGRGRNRKKPNPATNNGGEDRASPASSNSSRNRPDTTTNDARGRVRSRVPILLREAEQSTKQNPAQGGRVFGQKPEREIRPCGFKEIEELCGKLDSREMLPGSTDLMRKVTSMSFRKRMDEIWDHGKTEWTTHFLHVIVKAISHLQSNLMAMTHDFIDEILKSKLIEDVMKKHVNTLFGGGSALNSKLDLLNNFVLLITLILNRKPNIVSDFVQHFAVLKIVTDNKIEEGTELYENLDTLSKLVERLTQQRNAMVSSSDAEKKRRKKVEDVLEPPPEDFRTISVVPTKEDMLVIDRPYLRKNITKGHYDNGDHYLDVQFRLLREDFLDPLRSGVNSYRSAAGTRGKGDVYVYENVKIGFPELDKKMGEMVFRVQFKPRHRCRWIRQMIFGSLVVLSKDGFEQDFIFGTVAIRELRDLQKGIVKLLLPRMDDVDHAAGYRMIESSAYYEAYHHVLRGLQTFAPGEDIPFHKYLVDVNTEPGVPSYFARNNYKIDFGVIYGDNDSSYRHKKVIDVRRACEQINPADVHLDDSQHKALTMAFQQELVVIQGPPGTGKTHLGHQISRVLLANQNLWNYDQKHPMLVVCYTNHALDQFLNGILTFMNTDKNADKTIDKQLKMIRVGSRSKDASMQEYMLNEVKKSSKVRVPGDLNFQRREAFHARKDVMVKLEAQSKSLKALKENVVEMKSLSSKIFNGASLVDRKHVEQFQQYVVTYGDAKLELNDVFIEWLTRANRPDQQRHNEGATVRMDLELIERLMRSHAVPEFLAKNMCYLCKNDPAQFDMFYRTTTNEHMFELMNQPLNEIRHWPMVADMRHLMAALGVSEFDAYEAIIASAGNMDRAAEQLVMAIEQDMIIRAERELEAQANDAEEALSDIDILDQYEKEREDEFYDANEEFDDDAETFRRNALNRAREREVTQEAVGILESDSFRVPETNDDDGGGWQTSGQNARSERRERLKAYTKRILSAKPCTYENAIRVDDIWALPVQDRWRLYKYWATKLTEKCEGELRTYEEQYMHLTEKLKEISMMTDVEILKSARVIGMTTTGAARLQSVLRTIQCPVVIIEEAAEVLEAHIVTALTVKCKHVILIGDHKQLRPNPAVYDLARTYDLDVSLFERLVKNNFPYAMLKNQHRMRTEIARTLMPHFYDDLRDDPSVFQYEHIVGLTKSFAFITHKYAEKINMSRDDQKSHMNEYEGEYAIRLALYLLQQGYRPDQVTILCTYMEQMLFIRKKAIEKLGNDHSVRVEVVDNYQGEESDIIILTLVRSLNPEKKIGFLNVDNRVCVAMSRAKKGLYILGNIDFLADKCALWTNIKSSLEENDALVKDLTIVCQSHGNEQAISHWKDFDSKTAQGGCRLPCNYRLDCGHACPQLCHPTTHEKVNCTEPCGRTCPNGHACKKTCLDDCGLCFIKVNVTLPCGHAATKDCHFDTERVPCGKPCMQRLPCRHMCAENCSAPCTRSCKRSVVKTLPCGHSANMSCFEDPRNVKCNVKVMKKWTGCEHEVNVECWIDPLTSECPFPCNMNLPGCQHMCKGTCGTCRRGRMHVRCEEKCERELVCGHVCGSKCSTNCPPCEQPCETACFHSRCSSAVKSAYKDQKCRRDFHGKAKGRKCGELCPPCLQECSNNCVHVISPCDHVEEIVVDQTNGDENMEDQKAQEHHDRYTCPDAKKRICEKKCMELCDVEPCNERCSEKLKCGHQCLGLCGEDCPQICKECPFDSAVRQAYEEASNVFFGHEDDDDVLFIMLTCGHCIESSGMDGWVKSQLDGEQSDANQGNAIVQLRCPKCKTPIKKSRRYQKPMNQRINDIENIKRKLIGGSSEELEAERQRPLNEIHDLINTIEPSDDGRKLLKATAVRIRDEIKKVRRPQLTKDKTARYENVVKFTKKLLDILEQLETDETLMPRVVDGNRTRLVKPQLYFRSLKTSAKLFFGGEDINSRLNLEWHTLLSLFWKSFVVNTTASSLMFEQFGNELSRLDRWISLAQLFFKINTIGDPQEEVIDAINELNILLNRSKVSNNETLDDFKKLMKIVNYGTGISYEEKMEIRHALQGVVTAWYKCPKGHLYGIGDCGQAMVQSRCYECNAEIGGREHRLLQSNMLDREMTGELPYEVEPFRAFW